MYISYPAVFSAQILIEEKGIRTKFKQRLSNFATFFYYFLSKLFASYFFRIFFTRKLAKNWKKFRFGRFFKGFGRNRNFTETANFDRNRNRNFGRALLFFWKIAEKNLFQKQTLQKSKTKIDKFLIKK